jgi:hypothetical protein
LAGAWWWNRWSLEHAFGIPRHRNVNGMVDVIPIQGESDVLGSGPIFTNFVFLFQQLHQVVGIGSFGVCDTEVIHDKGEHQVAVFMFPQAMGDRTWCVAMWF